MLHLVCPGQGPAGGVLRKIREPATLAKVLGEGVCAKSQAQPQLPSFATPLGSLPPKPSPIPCPPPTQPDQAGSQGLPWGFVFFLDSDEFFWEFPAGDFLPQCPQTGCGNGLGLSTSSGLPPTWEPQATHPNHSFPTADPKAT